MPPTSLLWGKFQTIEKFYTCLYTHVGKITPSFVMGMTSSRSCTHIYLHTNKLFHICLYKNHETKQFGSHVQITFFLLYTNNITDIPYIHIKQSLKKNVTKNRKQGEISFSLVQKVEKQ